MQKKRIDKMTEIPDRNRSQRGATAVEFAFIAGLVFLIIFGILEFGLIFLQEHYVADAAREAARIGVRANNFNSYDDNSKRNGCLNIGIDSERCTDRKWRAQRVATDYLDIFYDQNDVVVDVDVDDTNYSLVVTITIDNSDVIKAGIIPFANDILFTASMEYEDRNEYTREQSP